MAYLLPENEPESHEAVPLGGAVRDDGECRNKGVGHLRAGNVAVFWPCRIVLLMMRGLHDDDDDDDIAP